MLGVFWPKFGQNRANFRGRELTCLRKNGTKGFNFGEIGPFWLIFTDAGKFGSHFLGSKKWGFLLIFWGYGDDLPPKKNEGKFSNLKLGKFCLNFYGDRLDWGG